MGKRIALIAVLAGSALLAPGCGGGDDGGGGGAGGSSTSTSGVTKGAKVAPTLDEAKGAKGTVTFCAGKDNSGGYQDAVTRFNDRYASQGLKAKLVEFPNGSDEQRAQAIQRLQAKSSQCDVYQADVIWTAEFASQKWLMDLTKYVESRQDEFIPSTLAPLKFDGHYWSVPQVTGAGLLYRRTDQVPDPPATWQQLYQEAAQHDGFAYQGAPYEGLTCNFVELASAAGGTILSADGKKAEFDTPENLNVLKFMVDGVHSGAAPKGVTTYMEEPARLAFEAGKATFMRNWSYAYALGQKAKKVKGRFAVSPLPSFEGGGKGGVLGGNGPVLSAYSKNPKGGLLFIDHLTSPETLERNMAKFSLPSVLNATYDAASVKQAVPYAAELKQAIETAKARPVSPVYPQISQAVNKNVNAALAGQMSPKQALKQGQAEITKALSSF
jgi:multiple sugar transport system substrate-binding protein